jgi:flagellar biogenesis protein FliO
MKPDTMYQTLKDSVESVSYGNSISFGWILLKMIFFLALLLILIFVLAYVYKKWMKAGIQFTSDQIYEIRSIVLGPGKGITFLKLFDEVVAIYHSGNSMIEIGRWKAAEMEERITNIDKTHPGFFKELLKKKMK